MKVDTHQRHLQDLQQRVRLTHEQHLKRLQVDARQMKDHHAKLIEAAKSQQHIVDVRA